MVVIGLKAFPAALVGGLDSLLGTLLGALIVATAEVLLIHYVNPLLADVVPFLVLLAMLIVRPWGLFGTPRRARPRMSVPHASGYFRTSYARDMALLDTRAQRVALAGVLLLALALPFVAAPFLLDLANQVLLAVIGVAGADAGHRLRRPDLARPRRPPGRRRLHHRHPGPRGSRAVLGDAAGRRAGRRPARLDLRPAQPAPARSLPGRLDAGAALRGHLPRQRVRVPARLLHRRRDRPAELGGCADQRRAPGTSCSSLLRRWHAAARRQSPALADRARLARHPGREAVAEALGINVPRYKVLAFIGQLDA